MIFIDLQGTNLALKKYTRFYLEERALPIWKIALPIHKILFSSERHSSLSKRKTADSVEKILFI